MKKIHIYQLDILIHLKNNFHNFHKPYKHMFLLSEPEVIKLAMKKSGLKQAGFAKKIGKSQAQVSKYISGDSKPSTETYIHCMNIINSSEQGDESLLDLINEVSRLDGDKHKHIRNALVEMIKAYKSAR